MKKLFLLIIAGILTAGMAGQAFGVVILTSDFTGSTISGTNNDTQTVPWFGLESGTASTLLAIDPGTLGFANDAGTGVVYLEHNLNIADRANPRGFSFTFTPGSGYDLIDLDVEVRHSTGSDGGQVFESDTTLSIVGSGISYSNTKTITHNRNFLPQNFDLSGEFLTAGQTYTVSLTMNDLVGNGAYFTADDLSLAGTVVVIPEPATVGMLVLVGPGVLFLLRRFRA